MSGRLLFVATTKCIFMTIRYEPDKMISKEMIVLHSILESNMVQRETERQYVVETQELGYIL